MPALSPAQRAVLDAVTDAPDVRRPARPDADLRVGDLVVVSAPRVADYATPVTKIGRIWITTGTGHGQMRFRRSTWRTEGDHGPGSYIRTPAQRDYDRRIAVARERLRDSGLLVSHTSDVSDGQLLAIAALLKLLDGDAPARALLDTTDPEGQS
jgi:hypothetical protein